jgi:hypothetical protein
MPVVTLPITPDGPVVTVLVGVSVPRAQAIQAAGGTPPAPVAARLLLDTGAGGTAVDEQIIKALGLQATGTVLCHSPTTGAVPQVMNEYDVGLVLPLQPAPQSHVLSFTISVIGADFSGQGIQGLIGRDVLAQCLFVYNGVQGQALLAV